MSLDTSEKRFLDAEKSAGVSCSDDNDNAGSSFAGSVDPSRLSENAANNPWIAAFWVVCWILLSSVVIFFNKYVIDTAGFGFPITLTCWHQVFATIMTQTLSCTTSLLDNRRNVKLTRKLYLQTVLPIATLYSGSLVSSNVPYLTLSVPFIQMLKGLGPVAVLLATCSLGLDEANSRTWLNVSVIVAGTMAASFGEIRFVLSGFLYQMGGLFFEAYRLALVQRLLSSDQHKMDPLVALHYYAPACAAMIAVPATIGEAQFLSLSSVREVGILTLVVNAVVVFLLNVSSVMLIGRTSSLILTLCGTLKNILIVVVSVFVLGTVVTPLQIFGYGVSLIGLFYFSLGADVVHGFLRTALTRSTPGQEAGTSRPRPTRANIAVVFISAAVSCGVIVGAAAGYYAKWDPRVYWYPASSSTPPIEPT